MRMTVILATIVALAVGLALPCQAADLGDLLLGRVAPLTKKAGDLDETWTRFTPVGPSDSPWAEIYAMMSSQQGIVCYTKGVTVVAGGETYLIAYSRPPGVSSRAALIGGGPAAAPPEPLTADTELTLSLLHLRTLGSLTDVRPFDLAEEVATQAEVAERAVRMQSLSNLKNLALAVQMFLADNNDVMPDLSTTEAMHSALTEYVRNDDVFTDPRTGEPYGVNTAMSEKRLVEVADVVATAVFYEQVASSDATRGVAFLDGHAGRISDREWQEVKRESGIE